MVVLGGGFALAQGARMHDGRMGGGRAAEWAWALA